MKSFMTKHQLHIKDSHARNEGEKTIRQIEDK